MIAKSLSPLMIIGGLGLSLAMSDAASVAPRDKGGAIVTGSIVRSSATGAATSGAGAPAIVVPLKSAAQDAGQGGEVIVEGSADRRRTGAVVGGPVIAPIHIPAAKEPEVRNSGAKSGGSITASEPRTDDESANRADAVVPPIKRVRTSVIPIKRVEGEAPTAVARPSGIEDPAAKGTAQRLPHLRGRQNLGAPTVRAGAGCGAGYVYAPKQQRCVRTPARR